MISKDDALNFHTNNMKLAKLTLCCFLVGSLLFSTTDCVEEQSCHSYADGNVFPVGADPEKTGHQLQYTKAVSKY